MPNCLLIYASCHNIVFQARKLAYKLIHDLKGAKRRWSVLQSHEVTSDAACLYTCFLLKLADPRITRGLCARSARTLACMATEMVEAIQVGEMLAVSTTIQRGLVTAKLTRASNSATPCGWTCIWGPHLMVWGLVSSRPLRCSSQRADATSRGM